ncbi:MAG: alpha/beta hydrolase [Polyangiaceae bacterium]|nr:alpha/beta hydrolase [Polyangiaceae bacterium]
MPFVTARDGAQLHVRVVGRGKPCLLMHGFGMQSLSWLAFVAPLLGRYRFILPDLRGFGPSHSVLLNQNCVLTNYAEDLEDIARALELRGAPIAGISMGAFATLQHFRLFGGELFSRYLHIDQGLVIRNAESAAHGLFGSEQGTYFARFHALLAALEAHADSAFDELPPSLRKEVWSLFADFAAVSFTSPIAQTFVRSVARTDALMTRIMPMRNWQTYVAILRAYLERDYDMREVVGALSIPMTVLVGGASRMYPPEGQRSIATLLPTARVIEVEGVGHFLPFEAPRRFQRELDRFLAGT